jgi:virulence factor Mce-like protein
VRRSLRNLIDPVTARTMEHPARNGAILLAVAVLVIVGAVLHKIPIIDSQSGYTIRADFAKVNNVNNRTPVRVDGVDVGTVSGVGAGPDARRSSELSLLITDSGLVVHSDASAAIRWRTVLGGPMYVDLNPGSPDAPKLTGAIPAARTSSQAELDDLLGIYNGSTDQAQRDTFKGLSQAFAAPAGTGASINALPDLQTVAAGLKPYSGTSRGDLSAVVAGTARTAQALGASVSSLQSLVTGARQTLGASDSQRMSLGEILSLSPGTLDSTYLTMGRLRTTLDHLDPLVVHLEPGAALLDSMSRALSPALGQTQAVLDQARPLLRSARPTFADLRSASVAGVPLLRDLEPSLARLNTNILPWLGQRDGDTRVINYQSIGPTFSVLDKAAAEFDQSGYRLHLSTLLGSASVIDVPTLRAAKTSMLSQCQQVARGRQRSDCAAVASVLLGALFGGQR